MLFKTIYEVTCFNRRLGMSEQNRDTDESCIITTNGGHESKLQNERLLDGRKSESKAQNTQKYSVKDQGWAWMIALAYFIHVFIYVGLGKSFGIFFVEFLEVYDTNSSTLSGVISTQNFVLCVMSLFVLNVGLKRFQSRHLVYLGTLLLSCAYIVTAFVPGEVALILSQGIIYGLGVSLTTPIISVELNKYFDKKLGFASMIAGSGGSVGSFVFPIIIRKFLDHFGLKGTLLLMAGVLLHDFIVGSLLRPFRQNPNLAKLSSEFNGEQNVIYIENKDKIEATAYKEMSKSEENMSTYYTLHDYNDLAKPSYSTPAAKSSTRIRSISESNYQEIKHTEVKQSFQGLSTELGRSGKIYSNFCTSTIMSSVYSLNVPSITKQSQSDGGIYIRNKNCCPKIFDFSLLKNRQLLLLFFACQISVASCGLIVIYVPPFAEDNHISDDNIAILVTIMGTCDFISIIGFAFVVDRIRPSIILGICLGITGLSTMLCPLLTTFQSFIPYCIVYGLFGNVYFSMAPIIVRHCVGVENYASALSILVQIHGLAFVGVTPLLGMARDMTGSYILTFYIMGIGFIIGSIAFFCEPIFERMEQKRNKQSKKPP